MLVDPATGELLANANDEIFQRLLESFDVFGINVIENIYQ